MSSTPVTPVPATAKPATPAPTIAQDIAAVEKKIGVWLDPVHIILVIMLIFASLGGVYLFESKEADAAAARAEIATQAANAAQAASASQAIQNAAIQAQAKEVEAALTAANAQLAQANAQLIASNKQITTALVAQQAKVPTLPPAQQATLKISRCLVKFCRRQRQAASYVPLSRLLGSVLLRSSHPCRHNLG